MGVDGFGSGKKHSLSNLIIHQPETDKLYSYPKDRYEAKYQFLINKQESAGLKSLSDSKTFIGYSFYMDDIYKNIEEYNPDKEQKILVVFDDIIADMLSNKNLNPIVTELLIRSRKLKISLVFITQSYFAVPKSIRLNFTDHFVMKIKNKRELQQIAFNQSSSIDFQNFMSLYKKCTEKPYSFLVIDTTFASDNPLRFRMKLLERI